MSPPVPADVCVFVGGGALTPGNSGKGQEGVVVLEPCLGKETDTESSRLYFVHLGTLLSSSAGG